MIGAQKEFLLWGGASPNTSLGAAAAAVMFKELLNSDPMVVEDMTWRVQVALAVHASGLVHADVAEWDRCISSTKVIARLLDLSFSLHKRVCY